MKFFSTIFFVLLASSGFCQTCWSIVHKIGASKQLICNLEYPVKENERLTVQNLRATKYGEKSNIDPSQVILRLHFRSDDKFVDFRFSPAKIGVTSEGIYIYNATILVNGAEVNEIEFIVKVKQRDTLEMMVSGTMQ